MCGEYRSIINMQMNSHLCVLCDTSWKPCISRQVEAVYRVHWLRVQLILAWKQNPFRFTSMTWRPYKSEMNLPNLRKCNQTDQQVNGSVSINKYMYWQQGCINDYTLFERITEKHLHLLDKIISCSWKSIKISL